GGGADDAGGAADFEPAAHGPQAAVLELPGVCGGETGGVLPLPAPGAAPADVRLVGVTAHRAPDTRTESVKPARGCVRRCPRPNPARGRASAAAPAPAL